MSGNFQKNVHHFPGHMRKALNTLERFVHAMDLAIEILDARAPNASKNPFLEEVLKNKPRLLFLSKADLADEAITRKWCEFFKEQGYMNASADFKKENLLKILREAAAPLIKEKEERANRLGQKKPLLKLFVVGIPNVGKSTFINQLLHRRVARVANRPGVTVAEQWLRVSDDFLLLDTPGILPMAYDDHQSAIKLALLGSLPQNILPLEELLETLLPYLLSEKPAKLSSIYGFSIEEIKNDNFSLLEKVAIKRGFLDRNGAYNFEKAGWSLIKDFQSAKLGKISLEIPDL